MDIAKIYQKKFCIIHIYNMNYYIKILKELTTTTPERQKKLEEIRDAYRQKPAYLQKPLETEKQRRNAESAERRKKRREKEVW